MSQYQRLLLIADPSRHEHAALQRAGALAEASGAALHIMAFVKPQVGFALLDSGLQEQTRAASLDKHGHWLQDKAGLLRRKGIEVTSEALWTDAPLEEILYYVEEMQPDLLIKDVQHEPALKRVFATPLDWHLLRECSVPVHLVAQVAHGLPRKVVAAVDLSQPKTQLAGLNERIIQVAYELALQCSAELHLLHAYDLARAYMAGPAGASNWTADFVEDLKNTLQASFDALAEGQGVPLDCRHFIKGPPVWAIADFVVQNQMDVVVMGVAHHRGVNKLIGGTTEQTLSKVSGSILAVKAPNKYEGRG